MRREVTGIVFGLALVSLVLVLAGPMMSLVQANYSGPNDGLIVADDSSVGTVAWATLSNALAQDDSYATAAVTRKDSISHYLKITNFGFTIPGGATIKGILVEADRYGYGATGGPDSKIRDNSIRLVKGGTIGGDDKASGSLWPASDTDTYVSYGTSTDLWGLTWFPADLNDSGFGVAVSAIKDTSGQDRVACIDHIRVTVYYNQAPVASNQSGLLVNSCSTLTVTLSGTDPDNDPLSYIVSSLPSHGDLYDGTGTGGTRIMSIPYTVTDVTHKVTYQPNVTYSLEDGFGFKVNDGEFDSDEATISLSVSGCDDLDYYDDWEYYCNDGEVWRHHIFHDSSCLDGECVEVSSNYTDEQFVEDCDLSDYYTDWVYYCNGDSIWRTRDFHDFYCLNSTCQEDVTAENEWVEDCPADYYTDWVYYCNGDSIWRTRDFHDFYCLNGTCQEDITPQSEWAEGCDDLDYYDDWVYYCSDGEVWKHRLFHDYSCVDGVCTEVDSYYADEQFVDDCNDDNPWTIDTCQNGQCVHIAAYDLTMAVDPDEGGTATDLTNEAPYAEGTEVSIKAEAAEGYQFVNWMAPSGGFDDASAEDTIFTMPAQNVTVTANFEETPPPPGDPTVSTQSATGVSTNSASLNMNYTVGDCTLVDLCFAYRESTGSAWSNTAWVAKSADGTHAATLSGLTSSTKYDFKAQLKYGASVIEGTTLQFTTATPSNPPAAGCFIATAAYGTPAAQQIDLLREFRDVVLLNDTLGSQFVALYSRFSPAVANLIAGNEILRSLARELLVAPIVRVIEATGDRWRD